MGVSPARSGCGRFGACGGPAVAHLPMPAWAECAIGAEPAPRSWSGQAASLDGDRPSCSRWAKWHPAPQSQRTHIPAPGVSLCRVLSLAVRCGEGLKVEEGDPVSANVPAEAGGTGGTEAATLVVMGATKHGELLNGFTSAPFTAGTSRNTIMRDRVMR